MIRLERMKEVEEHYISLIHSKGAAAYGNGKDFNYRQKFLAHRLMLMQEEDNTPLAKSKGGCTVTLNYIRKGDEEKQYTYVTWAGETNTPWTPFHNENDIMKIGKGKITAFDELLLRAIKKWAREEGIVAEVSSWYVDVPDEEEE